MIDRAALRRSYRPEENALATQRIDEARLPKGQGRQAAVMARYG